MLRSRAHTQPLEPQRTAAAPARPQSVGLSDKLRRAFHSAPFTLVGFQSTRLRSRFDPKTEIRAKPKWCAIGPEIHVRRTAGMPVGCRARGQAQWKAAGAESSRSASAEVLSFAWRLIKEL